MTFEDKLSGNSVEPSFDDDQIEASENLSPHVSEMEDLAELEVASKMGLPTYKAHWQLFVPTVIILAAYTAGLVWLFANQMTGTSLFRLFSLVLGVGVPLLAAHAFLRYQTVKLQFTETSMRIHKGWPKDTPVEVPYALIDDIKVKHGLVGRIFGGGTIIISLTTDNVIAVADLKSCKKIQSQFRKIAKQL